MCPATRQKFAMFNNPCYTVYCTQLIGKVRLFFMSFCCALNKISACRITTGDFCLAPRITRGGTRSPQALHKCPPHTTALCRFSVPVSNGTRIQMCIRRQKTSPLNPTRIGRQWAYINAWPLKVIVPYRFGEYSRGGFMSTRRLQQVPTGTLNMSPHRAYINAIAYTRVCYRHTLFCYRIIDGGLRAM